MAQIYQYRRSEEDRQQVQAGLQEYQELTEEETRQAFAPRRRPWDPQWGGKCPYEISEDEKRAMAKRNMAEQEPWLKAFDGVGVSIFFLACLLLFLVIFVQLGKITGWWGGGW